MFPPRYAVVTMAAAICGLVLAAGAGTRYGGPKALARTTDGEPWVARAVRMLADAGCDDVLVALGSGAEAARALVPDEARVIVVEDWVEGLSSTIRAGVAAASGADAVLITPVDTPDAPAAAALRVLERGLAVAPAADALARARYDGAPGHPVLIGRAHWPALVAELRGDRGAGGFLAARAVLEVECGDLWSGSDIDRR
ncbi:MAG TPA: nucleotidyltransferase family protein [Microbacterium sp.]|uniref:nucleotidyltransferase family protein n=1 Tax=Microbacterium sp. TaxID=51671 RepID=UPI002C23CF6B|nr:nucleotidyltransferase family protein [Microbacterium sp.]HWI30946.1 nucleotidyltransferase family protein [Microbacterium sp.]